MEKKTTKKKIQRKVKEVKRRLSNFEGFNNMTADKDLEMLEKKVEGSQAFQKVLKKVKQVSPKVLMNKLKEMKRLRAIEELQNSEDSDEESQELPKKDFKGIKLKELVKTTGRESFPPQNLCLLGDKLKVPKRKEIKVNDFIQKGGDDGEAKRRFSSVI